MYELTKSKYCKGLQCPKILWLDEHHPEFGENIANKSVLDNGTKVGELAISYFGEYELVGFNANKMKWWIEPGNSWKQLIILRKRVLL